jgi:hypothetical protein
MCVWDVITRVGYVRLMRALPLFQTCIPNTCTAALSTCLGTFAMQDYLSKTWQVGRGRTPLSRKFIPRYKAFLEGSHAMRSRSSLQSTTLRQLVGAFEPHQGPNGSYVAR